MKKLIYNKIKLLLKIKKYKPQKIKYNSYKNKNLNKINQPSLT